MVHCHNVGMTTQAVPGRPSDVAVVDPNDPDPAVIERAAALLTAGGLVAFPTETVYGLGAHATDLDAIHAVFAGKGRPPTDPLIVHVADVDQVDSVVSQWPEAAQQLADQFWPGPLTMILPRSTSIPDAITAGRGTVAVRIPSHPVALAVLRAASVPIAAPSANRFGRISPTTAEHVVSELHGVFDLLLDGGPTPLGVESTVIDLSGELPILLRPGAVTLEELSEELGPLQYRERASSDESVDAAAPGQFLRHYSPRTPLVMVDGNGNGALVDELRAALVERGVDAAVVELPETADLAARQLYASLRALDSRGFELLLVAALAPHGLGRAVNDRVFRAAQGRVVLDASRSTLDHLHDIVGT